VVAFWRVEGSTVCVGLRGPRELRVVVGRGTDVGSAGESVPTVMVFAPCTTHSRLVLGAHGVGFRPRGDVAAEPPAVESPASIRGVRYPNLFLGLKGTYELR
jgi:hypothetical protein